MQTLSLTQVVPEATHVNTNGTATLIDLHLVNTPSLLLNCEVIQAIGNSNHNGILLQFKWKSNQQQMRSQPRPIWRYAHADFNRACDMIDNTDWDTLISSNDIVSLLNWEQQFMQWEHIPFQKDKIFHGCQKTYSRLCGNVTTCTDKIKEQVFQETLDNTRLQETRLLQCFTMLKGFH